MIWAKIGDSLPGLGIVAAVLGIVLTMQSIGGPAAEVGHNVGAALVGTFLGVLLCYGFVSPLSVPDREPGGRWKSFFCSHQSRDGGLRQGHGPHRGGGIRQAGHYHGLSPQLSGGGRGLPGHQGKGLTA